MKKVFCKHCKWASNETGILELADNWRCKITKKKFQNPIGDKCIHMSKCEYKNANKQCTDYQRSWWKYWVK